MYRTGTDLTLMPMRPNHRKVVTVMQLKFDTLSEVAKDTRWA